MVKLEALDMDRVAKGVEVPFDLQPGIVFRIARFDNPDMLAWEGSREGRECLRELTLKYLPDVERANEEFKRVSMSKFVLLGWSGIDSDTAPGEQEPYSEERALEYLTDPRRNRVFVFVNLASKRDALFLEREKLGAEKNSGTA